MLEGSDLLSLVSNVRTICRKKHLLATREIHFPFIHPPFCITVTIPTELSWHNASVQEPKAAVFCDT